MVKSMINIRKLETELWESADLLRADSKVTSQEYCMPVLGLIFLRYAYSRFKFVEADILKDRPVRNGRVLPVEAADFKTKSAIFLPEEARYDYLLNLPDNTDMGQANMLFALLLNPTCQTDILSYRPFSTRLFQRFESIFPLAV